MTSQGLTYKSSQQRESNVPVSSSDEGREEGELSPNQRRPLQTPPGQGDSATLVPTRTEVAHPFDQKGVLQLLTGENAIPGEHQYLLVGHQQMIWTLP